MGLSDSEEAFLRQTLERAHAIMADNPDAYYEPNGTLIDPDFLAGYLQDAPMLRPTREVAVESFAIARHPLTNRQVKRWLPEHEGPNDDTGAWLSAQEVSTILDRAGWRLPFEAEWEYAARAGTRTITFRGDEIPGEHQLLGNYRDEARNRHSANPWGLVGLFSFAELCADEYTKSYTQAPFTAGKVGKRVTRGGSINVSPWQGCGEWLGMLSASRGCEAWSSLGVSLRPVAAL